MSSFNSFETGTVGFHNVRYEQPYIRTSSPRTRFDSHELHVNKARWNPGEVGASECIGNNMCVFSVALRGPRLKTPPECIVRDVPGLWKNQSSEFKRCCTLGRLEDPDFLLFAPKKTQNEAGSFKKQINGFRARPNETSPSIFSLPDDTTFGLVRRTPHLIKFRVRINFCSVQLKQTAWVALTGWDVVVRNPAADGGYAPVVYHSCPSRDQPIQPAQHLHSLDPASPLVMNHIS